MIKAALITRSTLHTVKGGDSIQVLKTAEELNKIGVKADVYLSTDSINYKQYDLLHLFNIIRPADHLYHINKSNKPYVLSSIYLDYSAFDTRGRGRLQRVLFKGLGKSGSEYVKNMYRYISGQDSLVSKPYILGHRKTMMQVLNTVALLLPNSVSEYNRLSLDTAFNGPYHVVPNGVDTNIFGTLSKDTKRKSKVISVAQIYGMKNQLELIRACNDLGFPLDIIGTPPPNHKRYYEMCREEAGSQVKFIDFMPQSALVQHYAAAKVHALPSWFETTGLSSLEAAAQGCQLVVGTIGDTRDYFKDMAHYCEADNRDSLKKALGDAMNDDDNRLRKYVLEHYTWKRAAEETLKAYQKVLHAKK